MLKAWPNPAFTETKIQFNTQKEVLTRYEVFDPNGTLYLKGQTVSSPTGFMINVQNLKTGIYFIRVIQDGRIGTTRIFKK